MVIILQLQLHFQLPYNWFTDQFIILIVSLSVCRLPPPDDQTSQSIKLSGKSNFYGNIFQMQMEPELK